ncbi:hypothetical protein RJ639_018939 [Escallonia herrerae]|uniref:DUF7734 domain-containing protein n=1 Tax=Escallonia herrerae TaxID=1293975 RepID=A0AA88V6S1_9ASTE|nr:hypothetical protein RJ639_018939 [Escallonia herrerae]
MLKHLGGWVKLFSLQEVLLPVSSNGTASSYNTVCIPSSIDGAPKLGRRRVSRARCSSRRRVRYDEDDDDDEDEYGHNAEIAMLELYSQSAKEEALLVSALVDEEEVEVLIFKGFSSSLSYRTSPDPSRSILPARAVIKSIDRIKGPFDPSNIEYLERGLTLEIFRSRL